MRFPFNAHRKFAVSAVLALLLPGFLSAQTKIEPVNSHDAILKGIQYNDDKEFTKAISQYDKVNENDSLYSTALYEKCYTLIDQERYDEAIAVAEAAMQSTVIKYPGLFSNLGSALDYAGQGERAIAVYDEGLKYFPKNSNLMYNKAVTQNKIGQYKEAIETLKQSVEMNPNHPGTHLLLGTLAAREGKTVQAILSLDAFLILESGTDRAFTALQLLEATCMQKPDLTEAKGIKLSEGDDFSEIELLLDNRVALSKKYKTSSDLTYDFIKQNQLVFEKLSYDAGDKGFWMKTYVPFFSQLFKDGQYENFSYFICNGLSDANATSVIKKHIADIKTFQQWGHDAWYTTHKTHQCTVNGKSGEYNYYFNDNGHIQLIGTIKTVGKDQLLVGDFESYSDNGALAATGKFDDKGKRTGTFTFYNDNGIVTEKTNYTNDKREGKSEIFYDNGNLHFDGVYKNDLTDGTSHEYFYLGGVSVEKTFKAGVLEGPYITYYENGNKNFVLTYKADKEEGLLTKYYPDGVKEREANYKGGLADGKYIEYYHNGQKSLERNYIKDEQDGPYTEYYPDGTIKMTGQAKAGADIGEIKSYFRNGKLESITRFDESGKQNGNMQSYDNDGKLYYIWNYSKGEISGYKYFAKDSTIYGEAKRSLSKFPFIGYYEDGTKRFEGNYEGSTQNGVWKYYDVYGNLESEETFKDDKLDGTDINYYRNGKVKSRIEYKNGDIDGYYVEYYPTGKMASQGYYKNDMQDGYWENYYADGTISSKRYYIEDEEFGWQRYFTETGKPDQAIFVEHGVTTKLVIFDTTGAPMDTLNTALKLTTREEPNYNGTPNFICTYKNGIRDGEVKWMGAKGQTEEIGTFSNNKKTGVWKWYMVEGGLAKEIPYDMGSIEGKYKTYHDNGKLASESEYVENDLNGASNYYHENGKPELTGTYLDDKRNGTFSYYDDLGQLQLVKYFNDGKLIGYAYNGTDGKLLPMIPVANGTAHIKALYQNGKVSVEYDIKNGDLNGDYKEYYSNGNLLEVSTFTDNLQVGNKKLYYSNGKIKSDENYSDDDLDGTSTYYYDNGKVKRTISYIMGTEYGTAKFYSSTGTLTQTITYYNGKIADEK